MVSASIRQGETAMNLHAKTPWTFDGHGINDRGGQRIVTMSASLKFQEDSAKLGALLAAAPELLEALKSILDGGIAEPVEVDKAMAAIAKAEGW